MTTERYSMKWVAADGYRAMGALQQFVDGSSLPYSLLELVKMRASQINRCAYCLDMHSKDALALGESSSCSTPGMRRCATASGSVPRSPGRRS